MFNVVDVQLSYFFFYVIKAFLAVHFFYKCDFFMRPTHVLFFFNFQTLINQLAINIFFFLKVIFHDKRGLSFTGLYILRNDCILFNFSRNTMCLC